MSLQGFYEVKLIFLRHLSVSKLREVVVAFVLPFMVAHQERIMAVVRCAVISVYGFSSEGLEFAVMVSKEMALCVNPEREQRV